jgi:cell shape-determining protein MreC
MSNELITIPIVMSIVLALGMQLVEIAESTSEKVINYADSMNSAVDCAFLGIDIKECAPELDSYSFKEDLQKTRDIIEELKALNLTIEQLEELQNLNQTAQ